MLRPFCAHVDSVGKPLTETNLYLYTANSPINRIDPLGLDWLDDLANFSAGMGDTITFGGTELIRKQMNDAYGWGPDAADKCSGWYQGGEWAGYAWWTAMIGAGSTPRGWLLGRGKGLLNSNDFIRFGWSWKGTAQNGKEIIRLAIGSKRLPIHWHFP